MMLPRCRGERKKEEASLSLERSATGRTVDQLCGGLGPVCFHERAGGPVPDKRGTVVNAAPIPFPRGSFSFAY